MGILTLFAVGILLAAILHFGGWITQADIKSVAARIRKSSGVLLVFLAAFLLTRNIGLAIFAAMLAYSVFSRTGWFPFGGARTISSGTISTVRTTYLEVSLDHATGAVSGRILRGRYSGRQLAELSQAEQAGLLAELRPVDAQAAQLLEAYLERTSPGWRDGSAGASSGRTRSSSQAMSLDEAYLVLGLAPGATRADVQAAHRNLMKRFHPDQGGSTYIASKVNEAKDVVLTHLSR
jgi:hypothetical protein